ncbi:GlxA family transcriptional regulator [Aquimarina sp. I32.4]|uniref:GlxA family transcriptional regulator n=1 Tax=Aquimarina sp. I32.4 TaxID=2053903 RepID=UPI000CDECD9A|nr:helix-turn-helix domain-containing protein [Aquimarina sp. I32.4]
MKKIIFIIPPSLELLDLAGPLQVFTEAKFYGFDILIEFYALHKKLISSAGLPIGEIKEYKQALPQKGDFIFIPGVHFENLQRQEEREEEFLIWLQEYAKKEIHICAMSNAAFILGEAGLLDNRECTTYWRRIDLLKELFPKARVVTDVLFVKSGTIYTSAGISAGIDLALSILEELKGPLFVNKVARGLVIYHRRSSKHTQHSIYLDYRNHINPKIHQVQDYMIANIASKITIEKLAENVSISSRSLSRVFKKETGITIIEYLTKLRIEKAKTLKNNPEYTIDFIASECGFTSARQLQRILKKNK